MTEPKLVTLERGWNIILLDTGIAPENVLRRAELPADVLNREQVRLSVDEYFALWDAIAEEDPDPALPIRLGRALSPEAFNPLTFAALCSSCLHVAVKRIRDYKRLIAPMRLVLDDGNDSLSVGWEWDDPTIRPPDLLMATELVFVTQLARIGTRADVRPTRVALPFEVEAKAAYEDYFGLAPVVADRHSVTFSVEDAARPFLTASESMWETFEPELRRRLTKLDAQALLSERVRSVLLECLPSGEASVDDTARRLGLSRRTLQRQLKAEGVAFSEIVKDTRERLSRHYLVNTTLAYGEIAFLVGFDEPSSFFRAFRDWTGTTPESLRLAAG